MGSLIVGTWVPSKRSAWPSRSVTHWPGQLNLQVETWRVHGFLSPNSSSNNNIRILLGFLHQDFQKCTILGRPIISSSPCARRFASVGDVVLWPNLRRVPGRSAQPVRSESNAGASGWSSWPGLAAVAIGLRSGSIGHLGVMGGVLRAAGKSSGWPSASFAAARCAPIVVGELGERAGRGGIGLLGFPRSVLDLSPFARASATARSAMTWRPERCWAAASSAGRGGQRRATTSTSRLPTVLCGRGFALRHDYGTPTAGDIPTTGVPAESPHDEPRGRGIGQGSDQ